jgi:hypothetical protein
MNLRTLTIITQGQCPVYEETITTRLWLVASHIGWIIAWFMAYHVDSRALMFMAIGAMLFSSLYHFTGAISFEIVDTLFAIVYLCLGPALLVSSDASLYEWVCGVLVMCMALAIYGVSTQRRIAGRCDLYVGWHALWHIAAALLTITIYAIYFGWLVF